MRLLELLLILAVFGTCRGCLTRSGARGDCVNIKKCRPVMELLQSRPPMKVYSALKRELCGFDGGDPKICCEFPKDQGQDLSPAEHSTEGGPTSTTDPTPIAEPISYESHPNARLLEHELCGPVPVESKIYGGSATGIFEFPWMALLAYADGGKTSDGQPDFRCGATIINRRYVLTAAHCVTSLSENLKCVGVRVGEHDLTKERDCEIIDNGAAYICSEKHQDLAVEKVLIHPRYSAVTLQDDIALIRLNASMNLKPASVRPICLPLRPSAVESARSGVVSGWGSTEDGSPMSSSLRKLQLPLVSAEACARAYRDQPFARLGLRQLCAGGERGRDSCSGDSGGPLQLVAPYRGEMRTVQIGLVSYGRRSCAVAGSPGVYTNVAAYVGWILDNLRE